MSAEENSPVDCFCRRGQGAKRREGARECAEKIPCSPLKRKAGRTLPADKTVKFKFLGTGMISVMPVPLLAARPRGCSLQDRTRYVPSACACRWTCQVHPHRPP